MSRWLKASPIIASVLLSAGCGYQQALTRMSDEACTPTGEDIRAAYRATNHERLVAEDKAVCARCPGEAALQCTGDPKALP